MILKTVHPFFLTHALFFIFTNTHACTYTLHTHTKRTQSILQFNFVVVFYVVSNAIGSTLNITRITRMHMGTYVCEANNGIPPTARQNFEVQVHCKFINIFIDKLSASTYLKEYSLCYCFTAEIPNQVPRGGARGAAKYWNNKQSYITTGFLLVLYCEGCLRLSFWAFLSLEP